MPLFCIVYGSTAVQPFSYSALHTLSLAAQRHNQQMQITGLLLYRNGDFMQALEGEQAVVETLFERIRCDARHCHVVSLLAEPIQRREYGGWSMALKSLSHAKVQFLEGPDAVGELMARERTPGQSLAHELMQRFHRGPGR